MRSFVCLRNTLVLAASLAALSLQSALALTLPSGTVTATATIGVNSFVDIALSGVPSGLSVGNNTYLGWCVAAENSNNPAFGSNVHQVTLVNTTDGSPLPMSVAGLPWNTINYILNHKLGSATDVQYAIWHFTDGIVLDAGSQQAAIDMVNDAMANGSGFVPGPNDVTGVLLVWAAPDGSLQPIVIEVPPPTAIECSDRFTAGGFIYNNGAKCTFGIQGGIQNGSFWGGINYIDHGTGMHVRGRTCTSYTVVSANCRQATYNVTVDGAAATATVVVCDNGEPGRNDTVQISLSTGYHAGGNLGGTGHGGGNVQLHKPKCGKGGKPEKGHK